MEIILIAAVARNRCIGNEGKLPWPFIPEDMARFSRITEGHPVFMGGNTWRSLPDKFRPLPKRRNLILSRTLGKNDAPPGVEVFSSLEECLKAVPRPIDVPKLFVIGGSEIYEMTIDLADTLLITDVEALPVGDTFFPEIDPHLWPNEPRIEYPASYLNKENPWPNFRYLTYQRRRPRS